MESYRVTFILTDHDKLTKHKICLEADSDLHPENHSTVIRPYYEYTEINRYYYDKLEALVYAGWLASLKTIGSPKIYPQYFEPLKSVLNIRDYVLTDKKSKFTEKETNVSSRSNFEPLNLAIKKLCREMIFKYETGTDKGQTNYAVI